MRDLGRPDPHVPAEEPLAIYARMSDAGVRFTWQRCL